MSENKFLMRYYLIFFSVVMGPFSTSISIPIFEQLRVNFGLNSLAQVSVAIFFYMFPFAIFQLFTGSFSDIVSKKLVVIAGFTIFIIGQFTILTSIIMKNFILYLLGFLIQGLGYSFINPTVLAILGILSPKSKRGLIMGIYTSVPGIGIILGSNLSRFFASFSWTLIFIIFPLIVILFLIFFIIATKKSQLVGQKPLELNLEDPNKDHSYKNIFFMTLSQLKTSLNLKIILIGLCGLFTFFTTITITNTINEQLRISLESMEELEIISLVNLILTFTGIISIIMGPITGVFLKRIKEFNMMVIGFAIMLLIIIFSVGNSVFYFLLISTLIYIGSTFIWPALFKITIEIDPDKRGINSGITNMFRFLGYSLVGPFYALLGIPIIYYLVFIFNLVAIINIIIIKKLKK